MLNSPFGKLHQMLLARLAEKAPLIRYADQDLGQLENYGIRPAVSWPCCLIDADDFDFTDLEKDHGQFGTGVIALRLGMVQYTDSNNLVPTNIRENALQYHEVEFEVYKAFHGWAPEGFSRMLRRKVSTEKREDDIRVRTMLFAISFTDDSAKPSRTTIARPEPTLV